MDSKRDFFNRLAGDWDNQNKPDDDARLESVMARIPIRRGDSLLDAGCGTGRLIPSLMKRIGDSGRLFEIDFSHSMLQEGRKKHLLHGLHFIQANAETLPFPDQSIDSIVCFSLFPHLDDKAGALRQFHRVLRSGKTLAVLHLTSRMEINHFHSRLEGPVRHDFLPGNVEMESLMKQAGFISPVIHDQPGLYLALARRP